MSALSPQICQFFHCSPVHSILSPDSQVPPRSVYANFLLSICWLLPALLPSFPLKPRLWLRVHNIVIEAAASQTVAHILWLGDVKDIPGFTVGIFSIASLGSRS